MKAAAVRRAPSTFLIYGISVAIIAMAAGGLYLFDLAASAPAQWVVGILAAAVLAVALVRDPFGMLCLIVFILPFSLGILQLEVGVVTLNPYTLGIILAAITAGIGVAFGSLRARTGREDLLVLALGATFLLSTFLARDLIEAGYLAFHGVFVPIITYFALKILVRTPEELRKVMVAFVAGATLFAAYGLLQFMRTEERLFVLEMPPISAAAVMSAALIVILYARWWRSLIGIVALVVLVAGLISTFSRGYMLLMIISPFIFWLMRGGRAGKAMIGMLAASLVATLVFAKSAELFYVARIDKQQEQTAERLTRLDFWMNSLYGRAQYYALGIDEFTRSPLVGNGFHKFFASEEGMRAVVWHNFHVEWLEYGGISAYLLYVILLATHFQAMARVARIDRTVAVNLAIIFTILLNGLTNSFTAGISPVLGFLFMALNRAYASGLPPRRPY